MTGTLRILPVTRLLNMINIAQETGCLTMQGYYKPVYLYFTEGRFAYAQVGETSEFPFALVLTSEELFPHRTKLIERKVKGNMTDLAFVLYLRDEFGIPQERIVERAIRYYGEIVYNVACWLDGESEFNKEKAVPEGAAKVRVDTNSVINAIRSVVEITHRATRGLPPDKMESRLARSAYCREINMAEYQPITYFERKAIYFIEKAKDDGTIAEIARKMQMENSEFMRIVNSLVDKGYVDIYTHDRSQRVTLSGGKTSFLMPPSTF